MASSHGDTNALNPPPPPPPGGPYLINLYNQQLHAPQSTGIQPSPATQTQQEAPSSSEKRALSHTSPRGDHGVGTHVMSLLNGGGSQEPSSSPQHQREIARSLTNPIRAPSCKLPNGRRLVGEHSVYDVDARLHGEVQPQLEVTPITKYGSDPQLVVGRQIAVNKIYICYGLKGGNIRVLNVNTASRALFRGHSQRVTDMAFFAEEVHLLASVSLDGKVFVWKISEGPEGGDEQPQITVKIALALQILGHEDAKHPRVCWHSHKQENLVVSIGKHVLLIDTSKAGRGVVFSAEAPSQCPLDQLIDGVRIVGNHDGEVSDLSMWQWMTTRLVSSSIDGTVKIWQDFKAQPVAVLRPHDGHPVNSATFVTSPERPDHVILITGGPLNREMKIWVPDGEEGWLLSADSGSWKCSQKLDLKSSTEPRAEEAFFNQVIALSEAGLLLLANAKRNAIYAVHLDYGSSPADTRMDYLSEFTVTMPILSFIGTNDRPEEPIVKVYCVQTQAIQQYTLDACLCLPPPIENVDLEKSDSSVSREANLVEGMSEPSELQPSELPSVDSVPKSHIPAGSASEETTTPAIVPSNGEPNTSLLPPGTSVTGSAYAPSPQLPLSPRLSRKLSGYQTPVDAIENLGGKGTSADEKMNAGGERNLEEGSRIKDKNITPDDDVSVMRTPQVFFKRPTHLVTPSEFLMGVSSAEASITNEDKRDRDADIQEVTIDSRDTEVEVKEVGESRSTNGEINYKDQTEHHPSEKRENKFCSQASNLSTEIAKDCLANREETFIPEESEGYGQSLQAGDNLDSRGESAKLPELVLSSGPPEPAATNSKGKKQKSKISQDPGLSATSSNVANQADSFSERSQSLINPVTDSLPQLLAMQEMMNQIMVSQKEMQRQLLNAANANVIKEGKRLEVALGRIIEKSNKSNADALWTRVQEERVKNEKAMRDQSQQIVNATTNFMSNDLNAIFEKMIKKEFAAIVPAIARAVAPAIEKAVSSAITESFQRALGDKAVNQLDKSVNSKLEATIAKQIQTQFQTTGRQSLQEAVRSSMEASVIPSFEKSCKTMFDQVDSAFQKGIAEHTNASQQRFDSGHSQLAHTLKETITSASLVAQALSHELAESQRNRLALAAAGENSAGSNPLATQRSSGPLGALLEKVEAPKDPRIELSKLISERKYEESFTSALQKSDVSIVSWLCSQVDLRGLLAMDPLPLNQGVLLSLLQQLACDISKDTSRKLAWMTDVVAAINPSDQMVVVHGRPIFEQVYQILHHHRNAQGSDVSAIRLIMHVINSMLMGCN